MDSDILLEQLKRIYTPSSGMRVVNGKCLDYRKPVKKKEDLNINFKLIQNTFFDENELKIYNFTTMVEDDIDIRGSISGLKL